MGIAVRNQSLATRCEICHQSDSFDPAQNKCHRCNNVQVTPSPAIDFTQENSNSWSMLLCKIGFHKWHNSRWERFCLRCHISQHVWRIIDKSILWRNTETTLDDNQLEAFSDIDLETPLPLRKWQCENCHRYVMRIHPPGIFEPCLYCGTLNYVSRKKTLKY